MGDGVPVNWVVLASRRKRKLSPCQSVARSSKKRALENDPHLAGCTPSADLNIVFGSDGRLCDH